MPTWSCVGGNGRLDDNFTVVARDMRIVLLLEDICSFAVWTSDLLFSRGEGGGFEPEGRKWLLLKRGDFWIGG